METCINIQYTKAHTLFRNIAVINICGEFNFWWFKRIVIGEVDIEKEETVLIGRAGGSRQRRLPCEIIIIFRLYRTHIILKWIIHGEFFKLLS